MRPSICTWILIAMIFVIHDNAVEGQESVASDRPEFAVSNSHSQGSDDTKATVAKVEMRHLASGFYTADANLGPLEPGQKYVAQIEIRNPSEENIPVDKTKTSCSCTGFNVPANMILAGESVVSDVSFTMPSSSEDGKYRFSVDLFGKGKHVLRLTVTAEIQGNLHINDAHRIVELQSGLNTLRIPVFVSRPIELENLRVAKTESLGDATLKIVNVSTRTYLELSIHSDELQESYLSGSVSVIDKLSGKSAKLTLLFTKSRPYRLSPSYVRFISVPNEANNKSFSANLILQIVDPALVPDHDLQVKCSMVGKKVKAVGVKKLSNQVYKIKLTLSKEEVESLDLSLDNKISWEFGLKDLQGVETTKFRLAK